MILEDGIKLYHGSYIAVDKPDLSKCQPGKDFGQGFYLTTDLNQAIRFVRSSVKKAQKNGIVIPDPHMGYVSEYEYFSSRNIKVYEFNDADKEWLHCVAGHRRKGIIATQLEEWDGYDIIAGKIANDNTNQVITTYINGILGQPGTDVADNTAIALLMPENLTNQICLKTDLALETISFVEAKMYPIK